MSEDSQLQESVLAALTWEPTVTAAHIGVTATAGVVTLSGHVESWAEKHAAETTSRRVRGVRAVADELEVRLPFDSRRSDTDVAAAAIDRLYWNVAVPKDRVQVKVEDGWVTLTGQVDRWFQKAAAERDIRPLLGVVGVSDQITIKAQVDTNSLSDDITHALHRSWFFDPTAVHVRADGGKVVLTGTVQSDHERQVAAETAWAAPGASAVVNDITVVS